MFPIIPMLGGVAALGVVNLVLRLRGQRKDMLIGIHLLLGIGALSVVVMLLKGASDDNGVPAGHFGNVAAGLLALTLFIGLAGPVYAKGSRARSNAVLAAHIVGGVAGVLAAALWATSL